MADISGVINAARMGLEKNLQRKQSLGDAGKYAGESLYRKFSDEQNRQDEIRKEQIQESQFSRTLSETAGNNNMQALLEMYGQVMANERAAMAGPIDREKDTDLWAKFQEGMGFVSGINEDWYTPENLTSFKQVYFDPNMQEKTQADFEEWLRSVPSEQDRVVLRAWFERAVREGQAVPEPKPDETRIPLGQRMAANLEADTERRIERQSEKTPIFPGAPITGSIGPLMFGPGEESSRPVPQAQSYQNPFAAGLDTEFSRPRSVNTESEINNWTQLKSDIDNLLKLIPRDLPEKEQQNLQSEYDKVIKDGLLSSPDATMTELRALKGYLNRLITRLGGY